MNDLFFKIISIIKKWVDKLYYSRYTLKRETLIREMFPWVNTLTLDDYSVINNFLVTITPSDLSKLIKVITTFYWLEVNRCVTSGNIQWIIKFQWLIDLCDSLADAQVILLREEEWSKI